MKVNRVSIIMKLLSFIVSLSVFIVLYGYFSKVLHNNINDRENVYQMDEDQDQITPGDKPDNLFWLVQVSDIHVSKFRGYDRAPDLQAFCKTHLTVIQPDLVIASGDLTDAKFLDLRGSKQFIEEWKTYHETIQYCQKIVPTWLDQRGNHDAFDTPDFDHESNLFRRYSAQGPVHPSSYVYHLQKPFGRYSFIGVDGSPNPGPKRPFNFFGYIRQNSETAVQQFLTESQHSNMTIGFGHYPTSLIATESGTSVRHLLRNMTAYICGHLHTLGGLITEMYARHQTGMLELELGDWKDNRLYRILAIDHDILSFSDGKMNQWPVVVVTNPKRAALLAPYHEPVHRMINSTHIRLLIFTPGFVTNAELYIDEIYLGRASQSDGPLYVAAWQPHKYKVGVHTLRLVVQDSLGNRMDHNHEFSLDGTSPLFAVSGRFALMVDLASFVQIMFFLLVAAYIAVIISLRNCHNIKPYYFSGERKLSNTLEQCYNTWLYRIWLASKTPKLFFSLLVFIVYVAIGPWFVGELLEGQTGVVFVWGMYVQFTYLPVIMTYAYGILQVMTFNIPLLMYLGYLLHYSQINTFIQTVMHQVRHVYLPLLILVGFTSYIALNEFPAAYGTKAFIIGPVRTGSVILSLYLFYVARSTKVTTSAGPNAIWLDVK